MMRDVSRARLFGDRIASSAMRSRWCSMPIAAMLLLACKLRGDQAPAAADVIADAAAPVPASVPRPDPVLPDDPAIRQALMPLVQEGVELGEIVVVTEVDELLAAVAPRRTVVLQPGEYVLPEEGTDDIERTSKLTLVGVGPPNPVLIRSEHSVWGLTLQGVSDVSFYNLEIGCERGRDRIPCIAAFEVVSSRRVRLDNVTVRGGADHAFSLYDVDGLSVSRASITSGSETIARMSASRGIEISDSEIHGWSGARSFELERTSLSIVRSSIEHVRVDGALFTLDGPNPLAELILDGRAPSGREANTKASFVRMLDASIRHGRFAALTNRPEAVVLSATIADAAQFSSAAGLQNARACHCHRRRRGDGWIQVSSCWRTMERCEREAELVDHSELALSGSSTGCAMVLGSAKADRGWSRFFENGHDWSLRAGLCSTSEPTSPKGNAHLWGHTIDDLRWKSLEVWDTWVNDKEVLITIPIETKSPQVLAAGETAETLTIRRWDGNVPRELRNRQPVLLTQEQALKMKPWETAEYVPWEAEGWTLAYPRGSIEGPAIAISHLADPSQRLTVPEPATSIPSDHPLIGRVDAALAISGARPHRVMAYELQSVEGRFPGGAQRLAALRAIQHMNDEIYSYDITSSVFTLDQHGHIMQFVCVHCGDTRIDWIADLDGDGYDEIGWSLQGIEGLDRHVTHLREDSTDDRLLYSHWL
jgi:hypothetical protein